MRAVSVCESACMLANACVQERSWDRTDWHAGVACQQPHVYNIQHVHSVTAPDAGKQASYMLRKHTHIFCETTTLISIIGTHFTMIQFTLM